MGVLRHDLDLVQGVILQALQHAKASSVMSKPVLPCLTHTRCWQVQASKMECGSIQCTSNLHRTLMQLTSLKCITGGKPVTVCRHLDGGWELNVLAGCGDGQATCRNCAGRIAKCLQQHRGALNSATCPAVILVCAAAVCSSMGPSGVRFEQASQ